MPYRKGLIRLNYGTKTKQVTWLIISTGSVRGNVGRTDVPNTVRGNVERTDVPNTVCGNVGCTDVLNVTIEEFMYLTGRSPYLDSSLLCSDY